MEHRGVRYAIRIGIAREQWRVAIHVPGKRLPEERTVFGTRKDAEITARSMINVWLKKPRAEKVLGVIGTKHSRPPAPKPTDHT